MGGPGGMMGGGMPDLSKMDPKQLEALQKQMPGLGGMKGPPTPSGGGLPGLPGGMKLPGLGGGGLPGLGKKK
jgi:signal recognition particle subunit SRP54